MITVTELTVLAPDGSKLHNGDGFHESFLLRSDQTATWSLVVETRPRLPFRIHPDTVKVVNAAPYEQPLALGSLRAYQRAWVVQNPPTSNVYVLVPGEAYPMQRGVQLYRRNPTGPRVNQDWDGSIVELDNWSAWASPPQFVTLSRPPNLT